MTDAPAGDSTGEPSSDQADDRSLAMFLQVYGTLPRAGPGGDEHTRRALGLVPTPQPAAVLDLGCGPGAQTLVLASALPEARIVAVDLLPSMVEEARRRIAEAGVGARVEAVVGDMADPPTREGGHDLIWCESAIYNLGVTEALVAWRARLRPGGAVVFSEPIWTVASPPDEIREFWQAEYPPISDRAGVEARIAAAGYRTVASFDLPDAAWMDDYYTPMEERIAALRTQYPDDPVAAEVAAAAEAEIDLFRRFSDSYAYAFFVVQPLERAATLAAEA